MGRREEASLEYSQAIALAPHEAWFHYRLSNVLLELSRREEALGESLKAITLARDFRSHLHLCNLLRDLGQQEEALKECRRAIALAKDVRSHLHLAALLQELGQQEEAMAQHQKGMALTPKDPQDFHDIAWYLATCPDPQFRNPGQAVELAKKAVELAPAQARYWTTLGVAHFRADDWKASVAALERSMTLRRGGDCIDWFFLAMAHWHLGDKEQAGKWYHQAVARLDKNAPRNEELRRFRAEAAALIKVKDEFPGNAERSPVAPGGLPSPRR
jgi:tetratricopeptide (TPR) repeat protein